MNIQRRKNRKGEYLDSYTIRVSYTDGSGKRRTESTTMTPEWYTESGRRRAESAVEKEVRAYGSEFEKKVLEGNIRHEGKMKFREFAHAWYENCADDLTENVRIGNWRTLERRAFPAFGNKEIAKIRPLDIDSLVKSMKDEGLAPGTIKRQISVISSVFRYAESMEVVPDNPCRKVKLPKNQSDNALHYFTVPQAKAFLRFVSQPWESEYAGSDRTTQNGTPYHVGDYSATHYVPMQYEAFFTLAIYSGARRGELVALRWCDLDFENCVLNITRAATRGKHGCYIKEPKTVSGIRSLTLPREVFRTLSQWKSSQRELSFRLGSSWEGFTGKDFDQNFVFIQMDTGRMMDPSTPGNFFRKTLKRYNAACTNDEDKLPEIRLHDLRHTSASILLDAGVSITEISRRLGHSNTSVTLNIYSHALPSADKQASDIISALFVANE